MVKEKKFYTPRQVRETMKRFGFLYADTSLARANSKSDEYEKMGYSPNVQHKEDGFYVLVDPKSLKDNAMEDDM
jgi:hypothetical protein